MSISENLIYLRIANKRIKNILKLKLPKNFTTYISLILILMTFCAYFEFSWHLQMFSFRKNWQLVIFANKCHRWQTKIRGLSAGAVGDPKIPQ